jgi:1-hydroxycarotenoid 3,4-desaturase
MDSGNRQEGRSHGMRTPRVVVIGAGVGGLVAALELAACGMAVTVVEQAGTPGGKLRQVVADGAAIDAGPTVFTMRWVFDELFAALGDTLDSHLTLHAAPILARHAWDADSRLDLFADRDCSAEAIGDFAGAAAARGYLAFCARARRIYEMLETPFLRSARATPLSLVAGGGLRGLGLLSSLAPFSSMWDALGEYFPDQRLRQLFGRYATYCGASPFAAPATLMLVAHVEQEGVWLLDGGMHRLAAVLGEQAAARGASFRYGMTVAEVVVTGGRASGVRLADGEVIGADAVLANTDVAAFAAGRLGAAARHAAPATRPADRSLSAVTFALRAHAGDFPLTRHNVFFSDDYAAEFRDIFEAGHLPGAPTVYVCAQDRDAADGAAPSGAERLLLIVNAPAIGDAAAFAPAMVEACAERAFALLQRCGLTVDRAAASILATTPVDFERLFPATGGALYGAASHGAMAAFRRPTAASRLPGLYLAGGSVHPGPGVPMAALSGRLAVARMKADLRWKD